MKNYKFSIFTPCYNGAKTIHRVFESMACQTYSCWEWIIVNDGSTDGSDTVIKDEIRKFKEEHPNAQIKYISQENRGKHRTWNDVVQMATGVFFIPADCDDSFLPNTIEFFNEKANEEKDLSKVSGFNVCCYDPEDSKLIGSPYPTNGMLSDNIELQYKYHIKGEHWGCIRTDLLKQYKFPEIKGHFYNESYLWFSFPRDGYKVRCFNECLRAYHTEASSLCNNKGYKFDRSNSLMQLSFTWWMITNVGYIIRKYSVKAYLTLFVQLFKCCIKTALSIR